MTIKDYGYYSVLFMFNYLWLLLYIFTSSNISFLIVEPIPGKVFRCQKSLQHIFLLITLWSVIYNNTSYKVENF